MELAQLTKWIAANPHSAVNVFGAVVALLVAVLVLRAVRSVL